MVVRHSESFAELSPTYRSLSPLASAGNNILTARSRSSHLLHAALDTTLTEVVPDHLRTLLVELFATQTDKLHLRLDLDRFLAAQAILAKLLDEEHEKVASMQVFMQITRGRDHSAVLEAFLDWHKLKLHSKGLSDASIKELIRRITDQMRDTPAVLAPATLEWQRRRKNHTLKKHRENEEKVRELTTKFKTAFEETQESQRKERLRLVSDAHALEKSHHEYLRTTLMPNRSTDDLGYG
eukprot:TRINITY_DN22296_c0_g1_i1.p1 TRINITY_DN22296_c0_g1~~TRINITY_DN22296_c0_g1_i1.p1  ORF type:complete len:239 (-),score=47.13 TRINITY_DN22296_c0_g1_i1:87-803(-)